MRMNTSTINFLLVHSPVVGPSTWRWVAEALREAGHEPAVPDLVAAAVSGNPVSFAAAAVEVAPSDQPVVLVGHSGAGAVLPLIAGRLGSWPQLSVFVDAGLPPCEGRCLAGGDFLGVLKEMSSDGILPKWSQWWGEGVLEAIVPDEDRRRIIESELPEVPLRFYETPLDLPGRWCERPAAYVLLSDGYRADADRAAALGWPVHARPGDHLDIVNDGQAIADVLLSLFERPQSSSRR